MAGSYTRELLSRSLYSGRCSARRRQPHSRSLHGESWPCYSVCRTGWQSSLALRSLGPGPYSLGPCCVTTTLLLLLLSCQGGKGSNLKSSAFYRYRVGGLSSRPCMGILETAWKTASLAGPSLR